MNHASLLKSNYTFNYLLHYLYAVLVISCCTIIASFMFSYLDSSNIIMLYILGVVFVTFISHPLRGPGIFTALISTFAFDFFFIPPYLSFSVSDIQYLITLVVMLVVSQTISGLMFRLSLQIETARRVSIQNESEKLRNILLTSISHDMKTPLTIIIGSAETLLQKKHLDYSVYYELVLNIVEEAKRLNNLIENVMKLVRLETKTITITKSIHPIQNIIRNVIKRYENNKEVNILFELSKPLPAIYIDPLLIDQLFSNLIDNAVKFSPPHATMRVTGRTYEKNILIKIEDQGPGVKNEDLENIFNKFYRSQSLTDKHGFGLGLAICKLIVEIHQGKIWADNLKQGGMAFYILLPKGESHAK